MKTRMYDTVETIIAPDRATMGKAAAAHVEELIAQILQRKETANIIFAAAPSQNEFLEYLTATKSIDWRRVVGMHMDEYFSLPPDAPQLFGTFLRDQLFARVPFREVHYLYPQAHDIQEECRRYACVLKQYPVDIVCMGIGENGHIAFNDPPIADFNDPELVKVAVLDDACRRQQVNDGCFSTVADVPVKALTLTIPALMAAEYLSVVVPSQRKAQAVLDTLTGSVTTRVPASILRTHRHVKLFLDPESASLLA